MKAPSTKHQAPKNNQAPSSKLPALPKHLAVLIAPRFQAALNQIGDCIDLLKHPHIQGPTATKAEWVLAIDDVQTRLVDLTCQATASRRAKK